MNIKNPVTFGAVVIPREGNEKLFSEKGRQLVPNRAVGFHVVKNGDAIDKLVLMTRDDLSPLGQSFSRAGANADVITTLMHKFPQLQGVYTESLAKLELFQHSILS